MPSLSGKVAIVTGSSRGIGRGIAERSGFIAAKIHTSLDGAKVVAIAHCESEADLEAMQQTPAFQNSLVTLKEEIVRAEPHSFKAMYAVEKDAI